MKPARHGSLLALTIAVCTACNAAPPATELVFVDGRAVAPAGDSLLAVTRSGLAGILVRDRRSNRVDTVGAGLLTSPHHIQHHDGRWYVSDVDIGHPFVVQLAANGELVRRIDLDTIAVAPHQFAVLPDGRLIVETAGGELVSLDDGAVSTFAIVRQGSRTGLLVAALGGVLHAAPGHDVTLYNAQGKLRWRLPWPWVDAAFVSDIAVDAQSRIHVIAGEEGRNAFVIFSLSPANGEVVRWSEPGPAASFAITRLGDITPIEASEWF